ncbi:ABC transporter permease [Oceanispirochaeta sp.]|jgi:oligopeptide transport system permease protein|uniref:ABC transporter permease n=1 Tax=Oceanispirochaeta sp. TaxID=2035350 RepID=UPI00260D9527|nr:ABC transporter permease [Oceanispirochaeta sp.]MDA3955452.1 ABC transporter permease [Oceanispirochaeta sp.]
MDSSQFEFIDRSSTEIPEQMRPSLTYWQDAWRRLKNHTMAMVGLCGVILIVFIAVFGPLFVKASYSDQNLDYANMPPRMEIYQLEEDYFVFLSNDYKLLRISGKGEIIGRLDKTKTDPINKLYTYEDGDVKVVLDFSYNLLKDKMGYPYDFSFLYGGEEITKPAKKVGNKTYPFGSDILGRDLMIRVMYGARISLTVALVASLVNLFIGVVYGSAAGYEGGRTDSIMMRIVDILNSIPLVLYVIIIMVIVGNRGLWTMIIALGSVYWVVMARLVRGQVLSLKAQEFVLAARALGVSKSHIISRHLIPNAMGPIIVSMTMMIPQAVFTEAFIGFIGLGVSAPMASWGTLANDALQGLLSYPYQLFFPSMAIALTMLSFNFLGDGLRDALDPRLRKG